MEFASPKRDLWITPGGGVAPGESHREALQRELLEEVGRDAFAIGPEIWVREAAFEDDGSWVWEREHFYLVPTERFVAEFDRNPEVKERLATSEVRWWRFNDLLRSSERFAPVVSENPNVHRPCRLPAV